MLTLIIFLLKVVLFGFVVYLLMGFTNTILANIGAKLVQVKFVGKLGFLFYSVVVTIINIYLFSFWGAYYNGIVEVYSPMYIKWIIVVFCIMNILLWSVGITKWMNAEKKEMDRFRYIGDEKRAYGKSLFVAALSMCIFILISFVVFRFTENLGTKMYFGFSDTLARILFEA